MNLTALVQDTEHVCCRYRVAAFRPFLERAGYRLDIQSAPRHAWSWFQLSRRLPSDSIVIVQRRMLSAWQLYLLRRGRRRLIFDFDDAVFLRDSYAPQGLRDARRRRGFARMVRAADAIAAGNAYLAEEAQRAVGQSFPSAEPEADKNVRLTCWVIPTCVDAERYPVAAHRREGSGVELVWIGSSSTLQGLERIRPLLEAVGQCYPALRLKLVCDRFLHLEHLPVLARRWTEAGEAAELASADIGIGWVPDDPWSRGKCGLKLLQYMAAGLPVVANAVGVQASMVRHGETGFLAETTEQWIEAIGRLANDAGLRRRMGQAGRILVEREYSVPAGAVKWLSLMESLNLKRRDMPPLAA